MGGDDGAILAYDRVGTEAEVVQYCIEEFEDPTGHRPRGGSQQPTHFSSYSAYSPSPQHPDSIGYLAAGPYANADADVHKNIPNTSPKSDEETPSAEDRTVPEKPVFATGVFQRVAVASILALGLQWCTTGASVLIHIMTPPKGIGCRATTFIVYGIVWATPLVQRVGSPGSSSNRPREAIGLEDFHRVRRRLHKVAGKGYRHRKRVRILDFVYHAVRGHI